MNAADIESMIRALSNWGRWGGADQLGALNLITPEKKRQAAALVREGRSFSLAHPVIKTAVGDTAAFGHSMLETGAAERIESSAGDSFSLAVHGYMQTHLDALCHVLHHGRMFNGYTLQEIGAQGSRQFGVERIRDGIFTRGVLMDMARLKGADYLSGATPILPADLDAWERHSGLRIQPGDAVLVRTGRWARHRAHGVWDIERDSAGLHASTLPWLKQRDIAVLASDLAADVMPSGVEGVRLPVHLVAIAAMGVPIIDNCDLEALGAWAAERRQWEFLLTAAPLVVEGGTGSPINPVATV